MAGQRNSYGKRSHYQSDHDNGGNKRRNASGEDRDLFVIHSDDTVYRYLCPTRKIGSVIGRGGEIVKQLRVDTKAKIRIGDTVPGVDERVVTIYSSSEETNNMFEESVDLVCPAQDALFKIHERVIVDDSRGDEESEGQSVTARLLVPSDQIGCIIGKGGLIVQSIRSDTGANIRILKDNHLPACAIESDELVQISGEAAVVKKALSQIAARLHDNPSRSQHTLASAVSGVYPSSGSLLAPNAGAPIVGIAPLLGPYGGGYNDAREWSRSLYSAPRDEMPSREFSLRLLCPTDNIGGVIGKGGAIINQIRHESGAVIKVDSSATAGNDCLIMISAKEAFEDAFSPTVEAAIRLQPRCSEKIERDSGIISFTSRLLVPSSQIGCLIGKGGSIISEIRRMTKANIRILSKDDLPKIAADDDEMVQITGDLDTAKDALIQVTTRLRVNMFDRDGAASSLMPVVPYLSMPADGSDGLSYETRDSKRHARGHSYSSAYGNPSDLADDNYGVYSSSQIGGSGSIYGVYGNHSSGRGGSSGVMDIAHCYLDGNTDAVEFCPHDGFTNILAASTYTLREGDCPGRDGSIVLFDVGNNSRRHLEVLHSLKCAGVFDIKWCPAESGNRMGPLLARADSEGFVGIHCLEKSFDGQNNMYLLKEERCEKISSSMCLCLDWNPSATAISVGLSDGSVSVLSFTESNLEIQQQWSAHKFETWAASFDLHNPHLVYSGSDDCNFVCWDTRDSPSNPVFHNSKAHTMGVCCIAKSITDPHIVLTGSYDEHIRVWDIRSTSKAMNARSLCLGGGVWRIKQHFSVPGLVLTACMNNGFALVDVTGEDVKILETYKKHDSLAYGADWQREKDGIAATCSFYDQLLRIWVPQCKISS